MAEGTYEYACMRAELLGVDKPDYEEFLRSKTESDVIEAEEADTENLREADIQNESMKGISGKLDELNSILQGTQKKLNNFKASCGSLTNLLKIKVGRRLSTSAQSQSGETASVADQPVDNSANNP